MLSISSNDRFHLYSEATDMRKSFDGLSGLVQNKIDANITSGDVFIFLNKRRTMMKLLKWERGGFVLFVKRLERGTFRPPEIKDLTSIHLEYTDLVLLIEGVLVKEYKRQKRYVI
ncbi:IS66 family insertion sequence element accessory protein TnpB [Halosquirtibacter laminarini]|uniref:IS66 family insertion sequence element accessory protein TnpB n=2 Tax=Halosquirtibacter laminarini TaxID=3374600 RepID=A0AC61NLU3_9BACT|nr:IS66 family insertion sequence element accessory protein TnpB [Prolixibacteraceae bacterium]QZE15134.1 IS66 family insertion sequence element accessory protein TnpB [Prolixibacteraceae bacterium]